MASSGFCFAITTAFLFIARKFLAISSCGTGAI